MKGKKDAVRTARQLLKACLPDGKLDLEKARVIVRKLAETKPRGYMPVLDAFIHLLRLEEEKRHAIVESAVVLEDETQEKVKGDLSKRYGDDLTFEFKTNEELLGGMRVRVGSDVWDGSVRARLQALKDALN